MDQEKDKNAPAENPAEKDDKNGTDNDVDQSALIAESEDCRDYMLSQTGVDCVTKSTKSDGANKKQKIAQIGLKSDKKDKKKKSKMKAVKNAKLLSFDDQ